MSSLPRPVIRSQQAPAPNRLLSGSLKSFSAPAPFRLPARSVEEEALHHQAEFFYLQKQIQTQTPMVIVMEDGEHIEGYIEWYDRDTLKVRGRAKTLIYKPAIKYMYKQSEVAPTIYSRGK